MGFDFFFSLFGKEFNLLTCSRFAIKNKNFKNKKNNSNNLLTVTMIIIATVIKIAITIMIIT